jgi:hypothetical protein
VALQAAVKERRPLGMVAVLAVVVGMLVVRSASHTPAVLVPEAAAVTGGMLVWRLPLFTNRPLQLVGTIVLAAFAGVEVARYLEPTLPGHASALAIVATFVGLLLLLAVLTSPAIPAISAGLLPVYLHITSPWYVVAVAAAMAPAAILTARTVGAPRRRLSGADALRIGATTSMLLVAATLVNSFAALPPLFVAAAETALAPREPRWPEVPARAGTLVSGFAVAVVLRSALPAPLVGTLAVAVALAIATWLGVRLPPALAYALVPLLFPPTEMVELGVFGLVGVTIATLWPPALARLLAVGQRHAASIALVQRKQPAAMSDNVEAEEAE